MAVICEAELGVGICVRTLIRRVCERMINLPRRQID
jgi:hypothetical protein